MSRSDIRQFRRQCSALLAGLALLAGMITLILACRVDEASAQSAVPNAPTPTGEDPYPFPPDHPNIDLMQQTAAQALEKSEGCIHCHQNAHDPHYKETVRLGCCDCHGGNPHTTDKTQAHVHPRFPDVFATSANPVRSYTVLNHECPEFIRFVNPGDLRVAHISCGTVNCHPKEVLQNRTSMMTHGAMLWEAALYNNGAIPFKHARYGESYSMHGTPQRLQNVPPPTEEDTRTKGILPFLDPLPRYEISQPGNILRIFERGGRFRTEIGIPERLEEPGRPRARLSNRGLGTENRTDPTFLGVQKTRLFDPTLNFLGTNDHPGDFRSSGCTACHVIYANDRNPLHSGPFARAGNMGLSHSSDPTIPKDEPGHPIQHRFTNAIPNSQCIVCHIHPGTNVVNSYLGYMWWDEETDGEFMYPKKEKHPSAQEYINSVLANPDETAAKGLWSDPEFLEHSAELNNQFKHIQLADFHGHGWLFRAVYKKDRHGNFLDHGGRIIEDVNNDKLQAAMVPPSSEEIEKGKQRDGVPVHYLDIHLEKGMHCIDCHFVQDCHGNTNLYQEVRAAIEIQCIDCHGSAAKRPALRTTGPAAPKEGRNLEALITPFGKHRFEREGDKIYQNSMVTEGLRWEIVQTKDTIDPNSSHYNERARLAKTVRFDADGKFVWGDIPNDDDTICAHQNKNMSCIACHSAWNQSCFGCHLPQKANIKSPQLHNQGDVTRNLVFYNFQTLRDDVYMLARDGDVTGNRIGPARSSCAIHVGSYNQNRESIYVQQQTISSEGLSGIAFSTNVPHTVRAGTPKKESGRSPYPEAYLAGRSETKMCTDCHLSVNNDNNAIMAQLLMLGTGYVNFIGRYCWIGAGEEGLAGVIVTEREEPQAVIGSYLHHLAFPEEYERHVQRGRLLEDAHEHPGKDISDNILHPLMKPEILQVQARGEYLYAACGEAGVRVFDIAFIDDKAFSERITTAPVSPFGQQFYIRTQYATAVAAAATTIAPDPTRHHRPENREPNISSIYGYLFIADKCEGLIAVPAATTINGNPLDNFLHREWTFNPKGVLTGARFIGIAGNNAYVCSDAGLVIVDLEDAKKPKVKGIIGNDILHHPKCLGFQFRYALVCDDDGIKVLDATDPNAPKLVTKVDLPEANSIYVARTYAYVAAGSKGLVIIDIENPEEPKIDQVFNANGCINDARDVKLGITYVSEFAYIADGKNGLRVVQLTSPETPGNYGFSPRPTPVLVATYRMPGCGKVLSVSRGVDRDRAVDEAGTQIAVFGRVGARPFNADEMHKMFLHNGKVWKVSDDPLHPIYGLPRTPGEAPASEEAAHQEQPATSDAPGARAPSVAPAPTNHLPDSDTPAKPAGNRPDADVPPKPPGVEVKWRKSAPKPDPGK